MATTTDFACNKDSRIAQSGSTELGSGTSDGLPYGTYSGYKYRALLGFSINMSGWTSITSATFNYKSSNQIHVAFGSDPTFTLQRLTGAWSEGSADGMSASNAVIYPGPAAVGSNSVIEDAPTAENTWGSVSILEMMRDVLTGSTFTGIRLIGTDNAGAESSSASQVGEIYSRNSGSGTAYIRITYETNRAPNAPTVSSPNVANGGLSASQTPTLNVNMTDPDGNAINNYRWQVDDNSDFSSPIQDVTVGSGGANGFTAGVVPAALARGGTYYFRAQAADVSVWGPWSATFSFKVASYPTLTVTEPSASGRLARLTYSAGSNWASPRMMVNWNLTCPDGGTQLNWQVEVFNDASGVSGTTLVNSGIVADTQSAWVAGANLIEGNYYHVQVSGTCSHGLIVVAPRYRVRARWGVGIYMGDMGALAIGSLALTTLDATDESNGGQGKVVLEYQTSTSAGIPSTWVSTIGAAGLNRYFWYRVWLLTWGASPAVSPTLNQLRVTYSTNTIVPDKWQIYYPADQAGDVSSYVYGTKSLRMKGRGVGSGHAVAQDVPIVPHTLYILSGRIQTNGDAMARIDLLIGGATVANSGHQLPNIEFEDPRSRMATEAWDSGNNTQVQVRCVVEGAVGTTAWFDAMKLEASTVVTPWQPGYVANAVVLDSGGLQIDGTQGGVFRLRASAGGVRDTVELGASGLVFAGDTQVSSSAKGSLVVGSADNTGPGTVILKAGATEAAEGGEVVLEGAAGRPGYHIDALNEGLRIHRDGLVPLHLTPKVWEVGSHLVIRTGGMAPPPVAGLVGSEVYYSLPYRDWFSYAPGVGWVGQQLYVATFTGGEFTTHPAGLVVGVYDLTARDYSIYVNDCNIAFYVSGGTALSASHRWDVWFDMGVVGAGMQAMVTIPIASGASNQWRKLTAPVSGVRDLGYASVRMYIQKTGTPGSLQIAGSMTYRIYLPTS